MQQSLPPGSPDIHGATSSTVKSLMEKNIIPIDTFVQTFLRTIMIGTEHRDSQVADAWLGCLLEIIPLLPLNVLQKDVTPNIISKTLHEQPLFQRVSSCRVIGALCKRYPDAILKRELLPVVLSLCQDVHADVRTEMTGQLPFVFQSLGHDVVEQLLMPLIVDLASEEMTKVKEASFLAIVNSLPLYRESSMVSTIIPLLKQLFDFALNADFLLLTVTENYGRILTAIERVVLASEKEYFLKYYLSVVERATEKQRWLTKSDLPTEQVLHYLPSDIAVVFRKHCASNYAAVVKVFYNETNRKHLDVLHAVLKGLVSDPYWDVRKVVAASFFEIMESYGKYKLLLKNECIKLLNDDIEDVLGGLMPSLACVLVDFARLDAFTTEQQDPQNSELMKALKHCEDILATTLNWRLQCLYIQQMEVMWFIFPSHIVYELFVAVYLQNLYRTRVSPLRLSYIRTILTNAKFLQNPVYRNEVKNKLLALSTDHSFYNRLLFVQACYIIIEIYSTSYFKENFYMGTINLSSDPVPNIRWGLCKLLPQLRNMIKLPKDKHLLKAFKACLSKIESDCDKEIQIMLRKVKYSLELPDQQAFPGDKAKEVEEKMLSSLNSKVVRLFPLSVMHMFDPLGPRSDKLLHLSQNDKTSLSTCMEKPDGVPCSSSLNSGNTSEKDSGFSDQEFLVDAGVSLNSFDRISAGSKERTSFKNKPAAVSINKDSRCQYKKVNGNQSELKSTPKKKPIQKQSIPVRKKTNLFDSGVKIPQLPSETRQYQYMSNVVKTCSAQPAELDKRKGRMVRQPEKRYSLDVMSTHRKTSYEEDLVESVQNLVATDREKNLVQIRDNGHQTTESMDINKNVTRPSSAVVCGGNTVQKRKKSQLPRPLSCVTLPAKNNGLDKTYSTSKLPIMRRS